MALDVPTVVGNIGHMPNLTTVTDADGESARLLTAHQVASLLQVSPEQVYRWCSRRDLASVKLGGRTLRIRREDLDTFLAERAA
jgi:excisionase family DNA binding protein